jgi:hypothetical protein
MSITACEVEARSVKDDDYGYVNIATTWKDKKVPVKSQNNKKIEAMWSNESVYGVIGSKVGDFIETYGWNSYRQEGIFTHRVIAEKLIKIFSGLKINEIEWKENPLGHTLKNGKPRLKRARWLPEKEVDIVHLYSDVYADVHEPKPITTDFFTAIRQENGCENNWFIFTRQAKEKLESMNFENLEIIERTING